MTKPLFLKSIKASFIGVINGVTITNKQDYDHVDTILTLLYDHYKHPYITNTNFVRALYHGVRDFNQTLTLCDNSNQIIHHVRNLIDSKFEYTSFKEFRFCANEQFKPYFNHVDELIETKA